MIQETIGETGRWWKVGNADVYDEVYAEMIELAFKAHDAEMRRAKEGWYLYWTGGRFIVQKHSSISPYRASPVSEDWMLSRSWQDPFTAWVEADGWMTERGR